MERPGVYGDVNRNSSICLKVENYSIEVCNTFCGYIKRFINKNIPL